MYILYIYNIIGIQYCTILKYNNIIIFHKNSVIISTAFAPTFKVAKLTKHRLRGRAHTRTYTRAWLCACVCACI